MGKSMIPVNTPTRGLEYWDEHPEYPSMDWRYEIANGDTRHGYWTWVKLQLGPRGGGSRLYKGKNNGAAKSFTKPA